MTLGEFYRERSHEGTMKRLKFPDEKLREYINAKSHPPEYWQGWQDALMYALRHYEEHTRETTDICPDCCHVVQGFFADIRFFAERIAMGEEGAAN